MTENRNETGKFVKGKSGNPGGRPKISDDVKQALKELVPTAIEKLTNIIHNSDDERILLEAIKTVMDRVLGKPKQEIESNNTNTNYNKDISNMSVEEIQAELAEKYGYNITKK